MLHGLLDMHLFFFERIKHKILEFYLRHVDLGFLLRICIFTSITVKDSIFRNLNIYYAKISLLPLCGGCNTWSVEAFRY